MYLAVLLVALFSARQTLASLGGYGFGGYGGYGTAGYGHLGGHGYAGYGGHNGGLFNYRRSGYGGYGGGYGLGGYGGYGGAYGLGGYGGYGLGSYGSYGLGGYGGTDTYGLGGYGSGRYGGGYGTAGYGAGYDNNGYGTKRQHENGRYGGYSGYDIGYGGLYYLPTLRDIAVIAFGNYDYGDYNYNNGYDGGSNNYNGIAVSNYDYNTRPDDYNGLEQDLGIYDSSSANRGYLITNGDDDGDDDALELAAENGHLSNAGSGGRGVQAAGGRRIGLGNAVAFEGTEEFIGTGPFNFESARGRAASKTLPNSSPATEEAVVGRHYGTGYAQQWNAASADRAASGSGVAASTRQAARDANQEALASFTQAATSAGAGAAGAGYAFRANPQFTGIQAVGVAEPAVRLGPVRAVAAGPPAINRASIGRGTAGGANVVSGVTGILVDSGDAVSISSDEGDAQENGDLYANLYGAAGEALQSRGYGTGYSASGYNLLNGGTGYGLGNYNQLNGDTGYGAYGYNQLNGYNNYY